MAEQIYSSQFTTAIAVASSSLWSELQFLQEHKISELISLPSLTFQPIISQSVLALAGIELNFLIVNCMRLCFCIYHYNSVDNSDVLVNAYTGSRPFLLLTVLTSEGGTQGAQLSPPTPGYPDHTAPHAAVKAGGRRRKEGTFRVGTFVFPRHRHTWWAPLSWRQLNTCLTMGNTQLIPCSALLEGAAFDLPIKLCFSQPTSFPSFTLLISSPSHQEGANRQLRGAQLYRGEPRHTGMYCHTTQIASS